MVAIDSIHVGRRHRKDMGDIKALAASIKEVGLLHPVVITPDNELIAGERRVEAFKQLGRDKIPATVVSLDDIVRGEFAENAIRKNFLPSEIDAIRRALEPVEKAAAKERQGSRTDLVETFHEVPRPQKSRDKIGDFAGVSGRTVDKIRDVAEAAAEDPERFGHLVEEMDRTGKVTGAHRKLKQARDEEEVFSLAPVEGKHKTLIIDPPWDYEWLSLAGRAAPGYATMSHDELLDLPVPGWAEDNCHLYLWTTNNFITRAVDLMKNWGFQHKTVITWVKPRWGLGSYFRNSTEQVLFGVRGKLRTRADNIATHFDAPTGAHSEKPDIFYDIVMRASYPPFGEVFQRTERADFRNLFEKREA
jgi:ParB/RepB/Spo0J family partition protein